MIIFSVAGLKCERTLRENTELLRRSSVMIKEHIVVPNLRTYSYSSRHKDDLNIVLQSLILPETTKIAFFNANNSL